MEPLFRISYDVSIEDTQKGFRQYLRKYRLKRQLLFSAAYLVAFVLGVDILIKNDNKMFGFVVIALCVGMLASQWIKPRIALKNLTTALENMPPEHYIAAFYEDRIEIQTILQEEESDTTVTETDSAEQDETETEVIQPEITVIRLAIDKLDIVKNEIGFILFLNKSLIYIFPTRCLTEEESEKIETYIREKAL